MEGLSGVFAPVPSPFTDDSSGPSEIRLARLLRRLMVAGVRGVVVASEMGEFTALSFSERKMLVEWVLRDSHNELSVIVNVSTLSTAASLDLAQHASRHGARAAVLHAPYYGRFSAEEQFGFFRTVSQHAQLPIILLPENPLVGEDVLSRLADTARLQIAEPLDDVPLSSAAFRAGNLEVRPEMSLANEDRTVPPPSLRIKMQQFGYAKAVKALLEADELDVGSTRGPLQELNMEQRRELCGLLGLA
ncbi:MAG: dihydrodipicolinate synthase family protein [Armatimonadetes bacterium]|nr:dihydrodipicolinate synthase family protein [Armatimonadota bacterium]